MTCYYPLPSYKVRFQFKANIKTPTTSSIPHAQIAADKGLLRSLPIQPTRPQQCFSSLHPQSIQSSTPEHPLPSNNFNLSYSRSDFKLCV